MKTRSPNTAHLISAVVGLFFTSTTPATELSPSSTFQIQPNGDAIRLTIMNPGDQVWIIQHSSDFIHWSEVNAWKVHNGNFHSSLNSDPSGPNFFRALYDPSRQEILSTT